MEEEIDKKILNIDGYKLEIDRLPTTRTAMYIRNNLNYIRDYKYDYKN